MVYYIIAPPSRLWEYQQMKESLLHLKNQNNKQGLVLCDFWETDE